MNTKRLVTSVALLLILSTSANAGWSLEKGFKDLGNIAAKPFKETERALKKARMVVDPGHYKKKAEKKARAAKAQAKAKILADKNQKASVISATISKLKNERNSLTTNKASLLEIQMLQLQINFQKSLKESIEAEYNRSLAKL